MSNDWAAWKAFRAGYLQAMKDAGRTPKTEGYDQDPEDHIWEMYSRYLFDELERLWCEERRRNG